MDRKSRSNHSVWRASRYDILWLPVHDQVVFLIDADGHAYPRERVVAASREQRFEIVPLVAHCHLGLGKILRGGGKREQAHEHLTTAMAMYREMAMTYWLEQADAELRQLG